MLYVDGMHVGDCVCLIQRLALPYVSSSSSYSSSSSESKDSRAAAHPLERCAHASLHGSQCARV